MAAKAKLTFEVRSLYTSNVLGYYDSVSERGARIMASRDHNMPYAHTSATLVVTEAETPEIVVIIERAYENNEQRAYAGTQEFYFSMRSTALAMMEKWNRDDNPADSDYVYERSIASGICYLCGETAAVLEHTGSGNWPYCAEHWAEHAYEAEISYMAASTPDVIVPPRPTAENDYSVTDGVDVSRGLALGTAPTVYDENATETVGDMRLSVTRGPVDAEGRTQYFYSVSVGDNMAMGSDLYSGVGMDHGPRDMLGTLATFLSAAAESYAYAMRQSVSLGDTENGTLFPEWIVEAAYIYSDELSMLAHDIEEGE